MIRHQAVADQPHPYPAASLPEQTHEVVVVVGVVKHLAALVAAVEGVIAVAADGGTSGAWHAAIVGGRQAGGKPLHLAQNRVVKGPLPSVRLRWPETTVNVPNDTRHITSRQSWDKALIP